MARAGAALIHCAPVLPPHIARNLGREIARGYYRDESEKVFKPIRSFFSKHDIAATCIRKVGHPAKVIAKVAESGRFELLVMGSHGHGALLNLVLGSVATQVLAHCSTPVLIVR